MGSHLSRVHLASREFLALIANYLRFSRRLKASPGIPVSNPTLSFWTVPNAPIAKHLSDLPSHADIIILGSGITGTSFARTILDYGSPLQVVMLDARDACSGASGRYVTPLYPGIINHSSHPGTVGTSTPSYIPSMASSRKITARKWQRK